MSAVRLAAVVLAAGASSRMGRIKALIAASPGETFLERAVRLCGESGCAPIVVVTGAHPLPIPAPARAVDNPAWAGGQLGSLVRGLEAIAPEAPDGALVHLVDHPRVTVETFRAVVEAFARTRAPLVRPRHRGRFGHPVIWSAASFELLRTAPLGAGARAVVHELGTAASVVDVEDAGILVDVDTPADL